MKGAIRWALAIAAACTVLAVTLGVLALDLHDDNASAANINVAVEGNYAFASTSIIASLPHLPPGQAPRITVTGGRLSLGLDRHVFWSLEMQSSRDSARTGRLSCEGTYSPEQRRVTPSQRYGYSGFPPDLDSRDAQTALFTQFCNGTAVDAIPFAGALDVIPQDGVVELKGLNGSITWRRE